MSRVEPYSSYDPFAWFYERHWNKDVSPQIVSAIDELLVPQLARGARVLDVCCGTGYTCAALERRGFKVAGLDGSKEMLRFARRRAPASRFIHADARAFDSPPVYDAVISTFDSLNHLMTLRDLSAVFENVRRALAPDGWFFFDMNMESGFLAHWAEHFSIVERDNVCVLRGEYDRRQKVGRYDITLFRRQGKDWRRMDARIEEKCYPAAEIKRALKQAGLREVAQYDAVRDLHLAEQVGRKFFLARHAV